MRSEWLHRLLLFPSAVLINFIYFSGMSLLALYRDLPGNSRIKAVLLGLSGLAITASMMIGQPARTRVLDWIPVPLMLMAYWQSGCFFQKPNLRLQETFESWDRKLLNALASMSPGPQTTGRITAILETAYLLCYPIVPLGVVALYISGRKDGVDIYWRAVLLSAYPCYALLPFIQTMPPRSLHKLKSDNAPSRIRRFNLWITSHLSHNANTFPSGHVAASMAIALILLRFAPPAGILFLVIGVAISLGCVAGRYHYAVDVIAALALAILIQFVIG